jgi:hypothetical protein
LATVDGNINRLPDPLILVNTIALQEAKTSTEIENIFTTEDELYKAVSDSVKERNTDPAKKRYKSIGRHYGQDITLYCKQGKLTTR